MAHARWLTGVTTKLSDRAGCPLGRFFDARNSRRLLRVTSGALGPTLRRQVAPDSGPRWRPGWLPARANAQNRPRCLLAPCLFTVRLGSLMMELPRGPCRSPDHCNTQPTCPRRASSPLHNHALQGLILEGTHMANLKLPLRQFLHLTAGAAAVPVLSRIARAQAYPSRPLRCIVGYAAGGGSDIFVPWWVSRSRSGSVNHSSSRTGPAPPAISPPRRSSVRPPMAIRSLVRMPLPRSTRRSMATSISISSATSRSHRHRYQVALTALGDNVRLRHRQLSHHQSQRFSGNDVRGIHRDPVPDGWISAQSL
jgi:hypothetical protein